MDTVDAPDPEPFGGLTAEQFGVVAPFLRESVIVLDEAWRVVANLSAPLGLLGWGDPNGSHALSHIHPDDVVQFADVGPGLSSTDAGWVGAAQIRLQRSDGTYGRYEITMHNRLDDPAIGGWVVCTRELAAAAEVAPELRSTLLAHSFADSLPQGVVVLDGHHALFANDRACTLLGTDPATIAIEGIRPLLADDDRERFVAAVRRLGRAPGRETVGFRRADGDPRRLEAALTSQRNADVLAGGESDALLVIAIVEDVTHAVERQEALERRATRDDLTDLHNRAWLLDHLHAVLSTGQPVTVAYVDLVGFKAVNDAHGHRAGDRVLASVASGLAAAFGTDAVARVGGDEFVVVLVGASADDADALAERCRAAVTDTPTSREHGVTASVGTAGAVPGDEPWGLLERADADMYTDKRAARQTG